MYGGARAAGKQHLYLKILAENIVKTMQEKKTLIIVRPGENYVLAPEKMFIIEKGK